MSPQELMNLRTQIKTMNFDPTELVNTVFCEIDDFAEVAEIIRDPLTEIQKCKIAYIVLQNTKRFKNGLDDWDRKRPQEKNGKHSKMFFVN